MKSQLNLCLFGASQISWQSMPITGFVSNKVRALLIYLAVTGQAHSRDTLAELLWADTPATKRENLKKALSNLRNLENIPLIEESRQTVALHLDFYCADVTEFMRLTKSIADDNFDMLKWAVSLYQGDFLADFNISLSYEFEQWALVKRERFKEQMAEMLRRLAECYTQRGELNQAIAVTRQLIQLQPWQENSYRRLMELLVHNGDRCAALKQYDLCRQKMLDELGSPTVSQSTEWLYTRILNHQIKPLPSSRPAIVTLESRIDNQNLPTEKIPKRNPLPAGSIMPFSHNPLFIGREKMLQTLIETLQPDGATRARQTKTAAICGLGGIGKTQVACEFVHRYGQIFSGGVFWLNFNNADSIAAEVTTCGGTGALELHPDFEQLALTEQVRLVRAAWQKPIPRLLIFDNCNEPALLDRWRPTSGGCRVIITSRRGDWEPALGVKILTLGVLSRSESLALLAYYCPGVNKEVLDAIAEELGDLPLALHLSGSYLRRHPHVDPAIYLKQLKDLQVLNHPSMWGCSFSPTNHIQHMGDTFAYSYNRLNLDDDIDILAVKLLSRATHIKPTEPIRYRLLMEDLGLALDNLDDIIKLDSAIAHLIELGIIERETNDILHIHRLVSRFVHCVSQDQI